MNEETATGLTAFVLIGGFLLASPFLLLGGIMLYALLGWVGVVLMVAMLGGIYWGFGSVFRAALLSGRS